MPLAGRHELPPLTMGDLSIAADALLRGLGGAGVMTEGDFEALIRMEVTFARKKGEYYACYEFGTAITPDSDQMMRIGTLAMVRLLLRCGSFRACYSKLSEASAAALRRKVAEPSGFAGLELEDTGYETLPALVAACRADGARQGGLGPASVPRRRRGDGALLVHRELRSAATLPAPDRDGAPAWHEPA